MTQSLTARISVVFTSSELAGLERAAKNLDLTLTQFIKQSALNASQSYLPAQNG